VTDLRVPDIIEKANCPIIDTDAGIVTEVSG
jgi:hypothetical protein